MHNAKISLIIVSDDIKKSESIAELSSHSYKNVEFCVALRGQSFISVAEKSTGEYLVFLNNSDNFTRHCLYSMVDKAIKTDADLTVCATAFFEGDARHYYNNDPFRTTDFDIACNDDNVNKFLCLYSMFCGTYVMGNKLISRRLFNSVKDKYIEFNQAQKKFPQTLSIGLLFNFLLFRHSTRTVNVRDHFYVFDRSIYDQTMADVFTKTSFSDLCIGLNAELDVINSELKRSICLTETGDFYEVFRKRYLRRVIRSYSLVRSTPQEFFREVFADKFRCSVKDLTPQPHEFDFDDVMTPLDPLYKKYEAIIDAIMDATTEYVFFDVFDTLILRPFWNSGDLQHLLFQPFANASAETFRLDFAMVRRTVAKNIGGWLKQHRPAGHAVNIHDIYDCIAETLFVDKSITDIVKKAEIDFEIRFCYPRKMVLDLYQFAKNLGIKTAAISNMYLPSEVISEMLEKCGYTDIKVYVSNEYGRAKRSGLYNDVKDDLQFSDFSRCVMIGDNIKEDVDSATALGIRAFYVPRTCSEFAQAKSYQNFNNSGGALLNPDKINNLTLKCLTSIAANMLYDFPFIQLNDQLIANDARHMGIYQLGVCVFSVAKWLVERVSDLDKLLFATRDGYLTRYAFDKIAVLFNDRHLPDTEMLVTSKQIQMPFVFCEAPDTTFLYDLNVVTVPSPEGLVNLLSDFVTDVDKIKYVFGRDYKRKHKDLFEMYKTITLFRKNNFFSEELFTEHRESISKYYGNYIDGQNVAVFDIGNSGRLGEIIKLVCGRQVDQYYLKQSFSHDLQRKQLHGFDIESFVPFSTVVGGYDHYYEQLFSSSYERRVGGFDYKNNIPQFCNRDITPATQQLACVHANTQLFVDEVVTRFGEYINSNLFDSKPQDGVLPLQYFCQMRQECDMQIIMFER